MTDVDTAAITRCPVVNIEPALNLAVDVNPCRTMCGDAVTTFVLIQPADLRITPRLNRVGADIATVLVLDPAGECTFRDTIGNLKRQNISPLPNSIATADHKFPSERVAAATGFSLSRSSPTDRSNVFGVTSS